MVHQAACIGLGEVLAGNCDRIQISTDEEGFITVAQNGNGLSMKTDRDDRVRAEVVLTHPLACRDMKQDKRATEFCQLGVVVVTAWSEQLEFRNCWHGEEWLIEFERGHKTLPLHRWVKRIRLEP